jgi:hypothetical protein
MTRRPGLTLTEVLVTLGILAFGVLALLTLFPLSASQMAIAAREDRSAQAAAAADGFIRAYWKSDIVDRARAGLPIAEPFFSALDDPDGPTPVLPPGRVNVSPANPDEVSYPVVIDPMGYWARGGLANQTWLGDMSPGLGTYVPRRNLQLTSGNLTYAFRVCSLMDGLGYDDDGHPRTDRELRYNYLWVIQRSLNANQYSAGLTVVVFDNRPNLYAPAGAEGVFSTTASGVVPNTNSVTLLDNAAGPPDVKPGNWIMDATVDPSGVAGGGTRIRQANFYQVVSVSPGLMGANTTTLELQAPLKQSTDPRVGSYTGTFVVLRGVSGVYVKPPLSAE